MGRTSCQSDVIRSEAIHGLTDKSGQFKTAYTSRYLVLL